MKGPILKTLYKNVGSQETTSLTAYLDKAVKDSSLYATAHERLLKAIGEPTLIDTAKNSSLSRLFGNKVIRTYKPFADFYGLEEVIERAVSFFVHAAQGLEESRQILYLLGPVGSAKSSLAERLKELMEQEPIYVLTDKEGNLSPVFESPLGLFPVTLSKDLQIPSRYLTLKASPWALKRVKEYGGDLTQFKVTKLYPSQNYQIGINKTEPGDENNQDISTLVGKLDIRQLEFLAQDDPDAYSYNGGLCKSNQGILDFVEMFKAPIKLLHPLLTATQEKNYKGTEPIGAIPFDGIIVAHSNVAEWQQFKSNKNNEAFIDRVYVIEVPYCLRVSEEIKIYKKLLQNSALAEAPCAPDTLKMLAEFCVLTRLDDPENSDIYAKMHIYNGENKSNLETNTKSFIEYKESASAKEGFFGASTRLAYKILAAVFNFDPEEIAADPVHLQLVIRKTIQNERLPAALAEKYEGFVQDYLIPDYLEKLSKDIQTAYLDSYNDYGQSLFDKYIIHADAWVQDIDYRDRNTGNLYDRESLNEELSKLEKLAGISDPKDFRHEIVNFALRYQTGHNGKNPDWKSYDKLKDVIEKTMFHKIEDLLPVISFDGHASEDVRKKHDVFKSNMLKLGYTANQIRRVVEWQQKLIK